ncbi:MAG: hypothetical protein ABL901_05150 [Hyphomicrobiaceae bacterium]
MAERTQYAVSWGKTIDYLFGRNALIAIASAMLLCISGFATWSGMNDFIIGASATGASKGREIAGGVSISHHSLVIAITIALTFLMWLALREAIGAQRRLIERIVTWPLYIFLALWSIGFGYGFWWSLIAGEEATKAGLTALQEDGREAGGSISARLDAVKGQVDSFASWSESQMQREETSGGSCGVSSGAGRGPLYNARRSTRDAVAALRDTITNSWLGPVNVELDNLKRAATGLSDGSPEERQKQFDTMSQQIRGAARNIASRSNELGKSTAAEMRGLADSVSVAPGQPGFSCYDPTLAQRLRQAADQASEPAKLNLRQATFNEGPAGVANAVKNLWTNMGSYLGNLVVYVFSGGNATPSATATGEPITGRDMIALLATIGIDLGLFVLALLDPPSAAPVRRDALAEAQGRLHEADPKVIRQLEQAFQTAIARAPDAKIEWVRQHFLHHSGASYFVIPNLYMVEEDGPGAEQGSKREELRALAINQLAGVFDDLKLVIALNGDELRAFGREERRESLTDLSAYRADNDAATITGVEAKQHPLKKLLRIKTNDEATAVGAGKAMRNHGLLSKAQRTLDIAGWSAQAQTDVEIFRLVDTEGLTPLLSVLNEANLERIEHDNADEAAKPLAQMPDLRKS